MNARINDVYITISLGVRSWNLADYKPEALHEQSGYLLIIRTEIKSQEAVKWTFRLNNKSRGELSYMDDIMLQGMAAHSLIGENLCKERKNEWDLL